MVSYSPGFVSSDSFDVAGVSNSKLGEMQGANPNFEYRTVVELFINGQFLESSVSPISMNPSVWTGSQNFAFDLAEGLETVTIRAVVSFQNRSLQFNDADMDSFAMHGKATSGTLHASNDSIEGAQAIWIPSSGATAEVTINCADAIDPVVSLCPDGRLNSNSCAPIAIYAAQDDDGTYTIVVYQSAPAEAIGTFLFQFTSEDVAEAQGTDSNVVLGASDFASAYLTPDGQIIFEAGPDFEGKVFYFTFDLTQFPNAEPVTSTNY